VATSSELSGRVALVTGSSRGIGRGIALALAQAGAEVAVNGRSRSAHLDSAAAAIVETGRRSIAVAADVSRPDEVERLVHVVEETLGPLDVLVNNAGIATVRTLDAITLEDWERTIAANLSSVFLVTRAALPGMRSRRFGRIINISSGAAQVGGVVGPHYAASKAGVLGLTRGYAALLAGEGITVNAIAPALVETDMLRQGDFRVRPDRIPVGRFGTVEEVAQVVTMLATNAYLTGQTIHLNGGLYLT
jgi:3-oxoacyl-[acyl-carrier protein] reductase